MRSLFQTPLIVAEKPSIARGIVRALSIAYGMKFKTEKGKSRYNRIFRAYIPHEQIINLIDSENNSIKTLKVAQGAEVSVSSVSGHLTSYDYPAPYDKDTDWSKTDPLDLVKVDAKEKPISQPLYDHVIELGARTDLLVIATDWDNQGESIGGQIARVVTQGLTSPPEVTRMRFTSTTVGALQGAFESQHSLDHLLIESVDSLRRQDLRMGASLTRHLTTGVQQQGRGIKRLVSYGPCQSSVLWIVANRYFERQRFVPLAFWRVFASVEQPIPQDAKTTRKAKAAPKTTDLDIKKSAKARKGKKSAIKTNNDFLFEWIKSPVSILSEATQIVGRLGSPAEATVFKREVTNQNIDRPKPLDTDTLESDCARLFGVSPKLISDIAEKLYNNGLITYPRTESSYYLLKDFSPTCEKFLQHEIYSSIADFCTKSGNAKNPSKGRFTKDHEPIIPVKAATEKEVAEALKGTDFENSIGWRIYDYVVRRVFFTIHIYCKLEQTTTTIVVKEEEFVHQGTRITLHGFLEIYPFRKVKESPIPVLQLNEKKIVDVNHRQEHTRPPELWSESQLIREMSRISIGTDATRSQHIATIQNRGFAKIQKPGRRLIPTDLGIAIYEIFTESAEELIIPKVRETVENWTKSIYDQTLSPKEVDEKVIELTSRGLIALRAGKANIFQKLLQGIEKATGEGQNYGPCAKCGFSLQLTHSLKNRRFLLCRNDSCNSRYSLPKKGELLLLEEACRACPGYPLQVGTGTKSWIFCPNCWTNRQDKEGLLFCSRCTYDNCPYSSVNRNYSLKAERGRMGDCPVCLKGQVALFFDEYRTIIECSECKTKWGAPNIRVGSSIEIGGPCKLCNLLTLVVKRKGKSPYNICVFCSLLCFQCVHRCYG